MSGDEQHDETDQTDQTPTDQAAEDAEELEEPAAPAHFSTSDHLQDPDAELSEALGNDTLSVQGFQNPLRLN